MRRCLITTKNAKRCLQMLFTPILTIVSRTSKIISYTHTWLGNCPDALDPTWTEYLLVYTVGVVRKFCKFRLVC